MNMPDLPRVPPTEQATSAEDNRLELSQSPVTPEDPNIQARLKSLIEAMQLETISFANSKNGPADKGFKILASSVSSALGEAATALTSMRSDNNPQSQAENPFLIEACKRDDIATVRKILTEGGTVHETTDDGESVSSLACSAGDDQFEEILPSMDADVEDRGLDMDRTALMEAASVGSVDIVYLLIRHGADVNAKSSSGNTPLMFGCAGGHEEVVELLLKAGANVEDHNDNGHTPLMEAAMAGHVPVAMILLKYGAGVNTHSTEFKESALTLACYKGHLDMVKFLLKAGADQEHRTDEMHNALMEAAMDGHVEVARVLLDCGAKVNMPTDSFESPSTLAACGGHNDLVMLLIERGANIEEVNDEGYTPLMEAAREGHMEVVALLLSQGAKINALTEETQETALTLACCGGFIEIVDFLLKAGAGIELGLPTPLMEAAQEGHLDLVRYLLESGADVHAQTQTGETALTYACENGLTDVADLLLQFGAELDHESEGGRTPLMKACRAGHLCTVHFLISKMAGINRNTTNNDHTPLSLACAGGHRAVVELLLAQSADPFHKLKDNSTMVIEAAKGGHTSVVQLLLDYPHSIMNAQRNDAVTPASMLSLQSPRQKPQPKQKSQKSLLRKNRSLTICDASMTSGEAQQVGAKPVEEAVASTTDDTEIVHQNSSDSISPSEPDVTLSPTSSPASASMSVENHEIVQEQQDHNKEILEEWRIEERELQTTVASYSSLDTTRSTEQKGEQKTADGGDSTDSLLPGMSNIDLSTKSATTPDLIDPLVSGCNFRKATEALNRKMNTGTSNTTMAPFAYLDVESATDGNNDTALTLACAAGHEELVEFLLDRGANIEHRDKKGFTPILLASSAGHRNVVDILLNHGADICAEAERTKDTALSLACTSGWINVVDLLLQWRAQREHRNLSDYTPLCLAASGGYVNVIKLLLNYGADVNSRWGSKLGITPLMLAAMNGHTPAVKLLLDMGSDINAQIETNRNTALTLACFQGRHEVVKLLLDHKANVEHRARTGLTPLMEAASGDFVEVGKILLAKGADVNAAPVPSSRDTVLTIAADKGHVQFVKLLLSKGVQVNVKNKKGNSPMWLAANGGHLNVVELLYQAKADIDCQDNRKVSCLMAAFRKGHIKVVQWFTRHVTQFPNEEEMSRYMGIIINDKELLAKCQECVKFIRAAKETHAARANINATRFLEELEMEKEREEAKKARKRERKKKKNEKKKNNSSASNDKDSSPDCAQCSHATETSHSRARGEHGC